MDYKKLEKLLKFSNLDIILIVEGKRDEEVLKKFGFKKIVKISGKPIEEIAEMVKGKEIAILTDFDKEGNKTRKELRKILEKDSKINTFLPYLLKSLRITKIEELKFFTKFVREFNKKLIIDNSL